MSESNFFSNLTAKDFPFDKEVVAIDSATPVDKAFKVLVDNHISAAPVFDKTKNEYVGFFDISDMLAYIIEMIHQRDAAQHCALRIAMSTCSCRAVAPVPEVFNDLAHFLMVLTHVVPVSVEQVSNHSHNNPFHPVYEDSPIVEACAALARAGGAHGRQVLELLAHRGVHRVPVVDRATGRITKLITQSAITKWLAHVRGCCHPPPPTRCRTRRRWKCCTQTP